MAVADPLLDWARPAIAFIEANLPSDRRAYDHSFITAYQIGCEALAAFGRASEICRGAVIRENPVIPETLPRWDDVCIAVLWIAKQQGKFIYHPQTPTGAGSVGGTTADRRGSPSSPNIAAAHGSGPAHASQDVLAVLNEIGLVSGARWTADAELVHWRDQPAEWDMDIASDHRFSEAMTMAIDTVPDDIRAQIACVVSDTDEDSRAPVARATHKNAQANKGRRVSLHIGRNELDWIFFQRWRLSDGWLTEDQTANNLDIFHDALAIQMRCAVLTALYPDHPEFHV
ncbi:hypothetical protein [Palleronia abyssalis]|uniref:Pellino n=1 Tax=Palleronia abyssalis TaxID=1501240 RepID=A0A2R8BZ15_9RHOB|nr:hypothetical protein [Palleronia abyssalis]SPJ25384.1 hypothetical protein PAA8504_03235 [Palleronia abyssalis]